MNSYYVEKDNQKMSTQKIEFFRENFFSQLAPHIHPPLEMLYVVQGSFQVFCNDIEQIAKVGDLMLFRSNTIHRLRALELGSYYYVLKLHPDLVFSLCSPHNSVNYLLDMSIFNENSKFVWTKEECDANGLTHIFENLIREVEQHQYGEELALKVGILHSFLIILRDVNARQKSLSQSDSEAINQNLMGKIYNAIVYINKHYAEEITAKDCSESVFLSYSYFSHMFKQITGKTFKEYLLITRINHAEKLLLTSDAPITQIATECGFNNVAYFSASYKKYKGTTPTEVRKNQEQSNM